MIFLTFERRLELVYRHNAISAAFRANDKAAAPQAGSACGRREFAKTAMRRDYGFATARANKTTARAEREIARYLAELDRQLSAALAN